MVLSASNRLEHALVRLRQVGGSLYGILGPLVFAGPFCWSVDFYQRSSTISLISSIANLKDASPTKRRGRARHAAWLQMRTNRSGAELRRTSSVRYTNMTAVNARFLSGRQNSATRQSCRRIHLNPQEIQVLSGDCYRIASPVPQANRGLTRELALNRRSSHLHCPPPH